MPLINVAGKIAPAMAAGNTVVIKPAPQDPLGILLLGEAVKKAGIPDGVVNIINGSGPEAPAVLVDSPDVDMISFTGFDHRRNPYLRKRRQDHEAIADGDGRQGRHDHDRGR